MSGTEKNVQVYYYALFRDARGRTEEMVATTSDTPRALYEELGLAEVFPMDPTRLKVAVNDEFGQWEDALKDGDTVVFIAPVAGGC